MLADITRLWTDLILKCYNVLYILILFNCGREKYTRLSLQKSTVLSKQMFQSQKKRQKKLNMIFHLTVAFRVTIWSFSCPWLPIWGVREIFISVTLWGKKYIQTNKWQKETSEYKDRRKHEIRISTVHLAPFFKIKIRQKRRHICNIHQSLWCLF